MADHDKYLIEELEKRLCWYRDEATEEEFDAEEVDAICVMLQKLSPIKEPHMTKEEAYEKIMLKIREEEAEREKCDEDRTDHICKRIRKAKRRDGTISLFHGRGYRAAMVFIAGFGAALLSLNMVTYAREDKSLFTMILEEVGVLEIVKEGDAEEIIISGGKDIGIFYDSWVDLDSDIKSRISAPEYIPKGYKLYGINYYELNNRRRMKANYYNEGNGHLLISVTIWEDSSDPYREMAIDEETYILLPEYSSDNILCYQCKDEYICMVSVENIFFGISGNIALEEIIKVKEGLTHFQGR